MTTGSTVKKSFVLYKDQADIIEEMSVNQAGKLFKAIYKYHETGEVCDVGSELKLTLMHLIKQFERDDDKYQTTCLKRRASGSKGGKQKVANASKCKQDLANVADSDSESDIDSESERDKKKSRSAPSGELNKSNTKPSLQSKNSGYSPEFEEFWKLYKKGSKAKAYEAWSKQRPSEDEREEILKVVPKYRDYCLSAERSLKDGQGWINGRFWEVEWTHEAQGTRPKAPTQASLKPTGWSSVI